jgi:mono/diheme cytochrome c family protein
MRTLLRRLLNADDYRARAAAVRVLRYTGHQVDGQPELLAQAAGDPHGRVRLEAIVAASWLEIDQGMAVLNEAAGHPLDDWMDQTYQAAMAHLVGEPPADLAEEEVDVELADAELELYLQGREIYGRDGYCGTCHGADGQGLTAAGFPPLAGTRWVTGSQERLIKLTLHGLAGPMEVLGREYPGSVPMTPFRGLLDDEQTAAVLTYVRNAFGNQAPAVSPDQVRRVREATSGRTAFYSPQELLEEHPLEE